MELSEINKLLQKYLEGETTLEEEKSLKVYFSSGDVAPELKEYQALFGYFEAEREQVPTEKTQVSQRRKYYSWFGVAASIAIVAGLFLFKPAQKPADYGTIEDPQIALQKTKEVLNLISQQMNAGKANLTYLYKIENTKNELMNE
jgi:hypothetical protein